MDRIDDVGREGKCILICSIVTVVLSYTLILDAIDVILCCKGGVGHAVNNGKTEYMTSSKLRTFRGCLGTCCVSGNGLGAGTGSL